MSDARLALARVGLSVRSQRNRSINGNPTAEQTAQDPYAPYLEDAIASYLDAVENSNRSLQTLKMYSAALRLFRHWLNTTTPDAHTGDLTHELLDRYVAYIRHDYVSSKGQRLSDRSIYQYVIVVKLFALWGTRGQRFWTLCPIGDYEVPQFTEHDIVPLTRDELTRIFAACGSDTSFSGRRLRAMFLMVLDTGVRRGELRKLRMEMIDLAIGRIRIPGAITKSRRPRSVHVQQAALRALRRWIEVRNVLPGVQPDSGPFFCQLDGQMISDRAIEELAVRLRQRAGVERFRWHLMRHTSGTEALRNGADSLDVQETLGHTTSMMTKRYLHLTDDDRRERHARYSPAQRFVANSEPREHRFGRTDRS